MLFYASHKLTGIFNNLVNVHADIFAEKVILHSWTVQILVHFTDTTP